MTANEYQKRALEYLIPKEFYIQRVPDAVIALYTVLGAITNPDENISSVKLLEGTMGLVGEAGEIDEIMKKSLFQGHKLDREHIALELGDTAWYLALAADAIGYDLETIFEKNLEKIKERYPDGFEFERSINRKEGDIRNGKRETAKNSVLFEYRQSGIKEIDLPKETVRSNHS